MTAPLASVVILSWNRPASTQTTLRALAQVDAGVPREIIVVDNGSGARTVEALREFQRQGLIDRLVLLPENRGTSPGYNVGFRAADPRCRFFTKLDNDIELLTPEWLGKLVGLLEADPGVGIISPEILNHVGIQQLPIISLKNGHPVRDWIGCPAGGGGMTFRRALYEDIGGFREDYGAGLLLMPDDLEFFFRVRQRRLGAYYSHVIRSQMVDQLEATSEAYQAFKKRQYFLLRTRYFDMARTGRRGACMPHFSTVEAFPTRLHAGQALRVRCAITAHEPRRMMLGGMLVRLETNETVDSHVTLDLELTAPASVHEWTLQTPASLPAGRYVVKAALWKDATAKTAAERLADLIQMDGAVEVVS